MNNHEIQKRLDEIDKKLDLLIEQSLTLSKVDVDAFGEEIKFVFYARKPDMTEAEVLLYNQKADVLKSKADEAFRRAALVRAEIGALLHEKAQLARLLENDAILKHPNVRQGETGLRSLSKARATGNMEIEPQFVELKAKS